jgi:hypothetical protein
MSIMRSRRNWRGAVAFPLDFLAARSHLRVVSISILVFIFVISIFVGSLFVISVFVIFIVDFYGGVWDRIGFQKMVGSMFSPVIGTLGGGLSAALYAPLSLPQLAAFEIARPGGTDGCGD